MEVPRSSVGAQAGDGDASGGSDLSGVLRAAARGDESAWRVVIARYSRRVYALAKSRVKSPELAEEVTQSVFVTVASKLGSGGYEEQGRFESWLFRVVMNRVRDEARRVSRQATPTDPSTMGGAEGLNGVSGGAGLDLGVAAALRGAIEQLPDQDREVIELRHHGQMSFKAMADLLEEPLGTLLARHHRALKKLHGLLVGVVGVESEDRSVARVIGSGPVGGVGVSKGGRRHER